MKIQKDDQIELIASKKDAVIIQRKLFGHTKRDIEIHSLDIPKNPFWLRTIVKMIRFYQHKISHKLGNRCVFDPSCSRYSELAYRENGIFKGSVLTVRRLLRCRPKNGGIDLLKMKNK